MHDPDNGVQGDCMRAVLACVLDLELADVPHFAAEAVGVADFWYRVSKWLRERDLIRAAFYYEGELDEVLEEFGSQYSLEYFVSGKSKNSHHIVVAKGTKIIWDTVTGETHSLIGPYDVDPDDGAKTWAISILQPL